MRIAAMDLGSNSFHLLVAEAHQDGTFEPLAWDKEMLRLGSRVARTGVIGEQAAGDAVEVVARFADLARSLEVDETVACATAALREAEDSATVVDRIEAETDVVVRVISGMEEARIIFEAVRASVAIDPAPVLALDLGGGSLELMVGGPAGLLWSTSLKLGVARLTADLVRSDPPSDGDRRRLARTVGAAIVPLLKHILPYHPRAVVGSSGTLTTLIRLAATRRSASPSGPGSAPAPRLVREPGLDPGLSLGSPPGTGAGSVNQVELGEWELDALTDELFAMTARERAGWRGVDTRRADLLPAGAVLLATVLELTGIDRVIGCDWALREGMVLETIRRHSPVDWQRDPTALRRESVLALCRRCGWAQAHSEKVARLALELFDGTQLLHQLGPEYRELLDLGALLHDIGEHVSVEDHERHTAYLVENGRLRGFRPDEVSVLACLGRFHRRGNPKSSFGPFAALAPEEQQRVTQLVALLQVADGLDRSHGGPVQSAKVYTNKPGVVEVVVEADDDIDLELWGMRRKRGLFERVFERRLDVGSAQLELPLGVAGLV